MTEKNYEIIGNDLIRKFMGYKYHEVVDIDYSDCGGVYTKTKIYSKHPIPVEKYIEDNQCYLKKDWITESNSLIYGDLLYHKSWDWLMPVIEEIELLGYRDEIVYKYDSYLKACYHQMIFYDKIYNEIVTGRLVHES